MISGFDIEEEVLRIFTAKASVGAGAHSDYCRIEGRTVNEWLSEPSAMRGFIDALKRKGWITTDERDPRDSRFWQLLVGDRAEMFGVFSDYELQAIFDWMRATHSADGMRFDAQPLSTGVVRRPLSFRAQQRMKAQRDDGDAEAIVEHSAPAQHWTVEGLEATRRIATAARGG